MIDRKPLKLGANGARRADKAVRPTLGAGFGCAPALAALPAVQERCKVGVQEPAYGECRSRPERRHGQTTLAVLTSPPRLGGCGPYRSGANSTVDTPHLRDVGLAGFRQRAPDAS
jgi:hypothetical protein